MGEQEVHSAFIRFLDICFQKVGTEKLADATLHEELLYVQLDKLERHLKPDAGEDHNL